MDNSNDAIPSPSKQTEDVCESSLTTSQNDNVVIFTIVQKFNIYKRN